MAEDKDNSGGWFPNFNHRLLVLLAGTLFVSQTPFHESRPGKAETSQHPVHPVYARTWQDPFEEVDKYIEEHKDSPKDLDKLETLRRTIEKKAYANDLVKINVVAVMLPGAPHFEDSEMRRRLRYAVLSGFNAALRYMPETPEHIYFFLTKEAEEGPKSSRIAYEWIVYKPTDHKVPPTVFEDKDAERRYERPPVLLLWLNGEDFSITPHKKLKDLIGALASQQKNSKSKIGQVSILGPFDSDGLQDLVREVSKDTQDNKSCEKMNDDICYAYFSPSSTVQECNLLRDYTGFEDCDKLERVNKDDLQRYFNEHGLKFLRITATDLHLAYSVKAELKLRGIEPSKENRILLVGEWDSLYDWHLSNTFAGTLLEGHGKECEGQAFDTLHDIKTQCIFRASYLRGLDGEKQIASGSKKSPSGQKNAGEAIRGATENLETASGDSQFDYVRRLAVQIEKLDRKIRDAGNWSLYHEVHAIKAIGILGSDVYDKLLLDVQVFKLRKTAGKRVS